MSMNDLLMREEELLHEIEDFNREKERIKELIGKIGGKSYSRRDNIVNMVFLTIIVVGFVLEMTTHFLPTYISIEIGVLLVSIKIVWMIHSQGKYNHFVFWILNSIEFRINDIAKKVRAIEKSIEAIERDASEAS